MKNIKVIFMGTPEFAVPVLEELIKNTNVILVVSQPDKEVGRKKELKLTPIKEVALNNKIDVFQPKKIREDYEIISECNPDLIVTCAYGQIIPKEILSIPRLGCINVHASLLPKLRGGAPIHHALIDGYKKTGVTIMYMDEHMDSGDIIKQEEYQIKDTDNVEILHHLLAKMGSELLIDVLPSIINGTNPRIKQNEDLVTYGYNIKREEEHIDFNKDGISIINQIRGLNSWPLANIRINDVEYKVIKAHYVKTASKPFKIEVVSNKEFAIGCLDGYIYIDEIKPFGKKQMNIKDYLNGINKEELKEGVVS